jgi:hypothetical protein
MNADMKGMGIQVVSCQMVSVNRSVCTGLDWSDQCDNAEAVHPVGLHDAVWVTLLTRVGNKRWSECLDLPSRRLLVDAGKSDTF